MGKVIKRRELCAVDGLPDDMHPVLRRIYSARAITSGSQLEYSLGQLLPHNGLSNIDQAAELLANAIERQNRILIVADYDADGATGCAVGIRGLQALGATDVHYLVPDRFRHGYGLGTDVVELAAELSPDILVTVDNGISSIDGVALARTKGIDVIVTDHHLPGKQLPNANAIVNPNLPDDGFISKSLAGVGVMFYVLAALRACLRERQWFERTGIAEPKLTSVLDLVALGTVADMVALDYNNRILVARGIERIRRGLCSPGLLALLQVANRSPHTCTTSDLGYAVGPRLNAAGRLTDMRLGIECLICDDPNRAAEMAAKLDDLNKERQKIQADMQAEAFTGLEDMQLDENKLPFGICLYNDEWHQGVVGILASRIKEKLHRPVIAFAGEGENLLKGSGRSINGIHIRDVIARIDTENPGMIIKFGGHAMAAGLTLNRACYEIFSDCFDRELRKHAELVDFSSMVLSDGELTAKELCLEFAEIIRNIEPWGQGFPEPLFDGEFELLESRVVGDKHLKMRLVAGDNGQPVDAIAFHATDENRGIETARIQTAYRIDVNEYMGRRKLQLILEYFEPVP